MKASMISHMSNSPVILPPKPITLAFNCSFRHKELLSYHEPRQNELLNFVDSVVDTNTSTTDTNPKISLCPLTTASPTFYQKLGSVFAHDRKVPKSMTSCPFDFKNSETAIFSSVTMWSHPIAILILIYLSYCNLISTFCSTYRHEFGDDHRRIYR